SRLDGYRQAAGAVFLGFFAALLTFDSSLVRVLIDPSFIMSLLPGHETYLYGVVGGALIIIAGLGFLAWWTIKKLGDHFAEMTSIVYKIDCINEVFTKSAWVQGYPLYPLNFEATEKVGHREKDPELIGWQDPSIGWFREVAFWSVV